MSLYNTPKQIKKTVSSAGTRTALASSETVFKSAIIQANVGNGGKIFIGDSSVSSSLYGVFLSPTTIYSLGIGGDNNNSEFDLSLIYIDTDNSGDGVSVLYF